MSIDLTGKAGKAPSIKHFLGEGPSLIEDYLERQGDLTAVQRFSQAHDRMHEKGARPSLENHYRDLLPLEYPKEGQQFSFEVDLDRCTGCKACVTACHNLNGLDEGETWRSVGMIHSVRGKPLQQTVTTACQHCLEPGCAHGCPTKAYEKDPVTGIVRHLDDQCFGCQYCILKCPYDVPQYHEKKGIVRKCDMCIGRLEAGEAPACVQACPTKAIRIVLVDVAEVRANPENYAALAGAPDPRHTLPTTRYKTVRKFPAEMEAADAHQVRREKAHLPLVFMLVISQMAAGFYLFLEAAAAFGGVFASPRFQALGHGAGLLMVLSAIAISISHLGRPLLAFRAVLGLRRSWLSREIVAFGLWAAVAGAAASGSVLAILPAASWPPAARLAALLADAGASPWMRAAVVLMALLTIHCSAMVYRDTPRALWATRLTSTKFLFSGAATGAAAFLALAAPFAASFPSDWREPLGVTFGWLRLAVCLALPAFLVVKLACEAGVQRHIDDQEPNPLKKAAQLLRGELKLYHALRFNAGLLGGMLLPLLWAYRGFGTGAGDIAMGLGILALVLAGECLERFLFFTACVPPRMPGS